MDINAYGSAVLQSMIDARNPMARLVMKQMDDESNDRDIARDRERAAFVEELARKLKDAKDHGEDDAVIQAYTRLMEKHSNKAR